MRVPVGAAVAGAVGVTLALGGVVYAAQAPAVTSPEVTSPEVESPECATEASNPGDAAALAAACGHDVEVLSERTEWDTVFAQPDGLTRVDASIAAVRTEVSGSWGEIDTSLVAADTGIEVVAPVIEMTFSDGSAGMPLARLVRDGHELTFDVPFTLPEPVIAGSSLEYPSVLDGVDLILTVDHDGTGFTETLRIQSPAGAQHPELASLAFPIEVSDDLRVEANEGGFVAKDPSDEVVFKSPPPLMWDSAADALLAGQAATPQEALRLEAGPGPHSAGQDGRAASPEHGDRIELIPADVSDTSVTLTPGTELLTSPDTVWPVYIDPSLSGHKSDWSAVRDTFPTAYQFANDEGVGFCHQPSSSTCTGTFTSRLMWEFAMEPPFSALAASDVLSATFSVYGTHSYSCTPARVDVYRINGFTQNTGWPAGPWTQDRYTNYRTVAHRASCANQGWVEFDVTAAARHQAGIGSSAMALGLRANSENNMLGWKRYRHDATLSVVYNRAPTLPTAVSTTNPESSCVQGSGRPWIRQTTPTLWAVLSDPDGSNVRGSFELWNLSTNQKVWGPVLSEFRYSNRSHSQPVPAGVMVDGGTYQWKVKGIDAYGAVGPVRSCEFSVDTTRPSIPTVTPVPGQQAVYSSDGVNGGIGEHGAFTITSASSDVVGYEYSFNSDSLADPATGSSVQLPFEPEQAGPNTLRVVAIDRAANRSDVRLYRFYVAFPGLMGHWPIDEGTGTTVGNQVTGSPPLGIAPGVTWGQGLLQQTGIHPGDRALTFDADAETASTNQPVIATNESFTIEATVRLNDLGSTATAVSNDGLVNSGFELGMTISNDCPTTDGKCWTFRMPVADDPDADAETAYSTVPVQQDAWVHLVGMYDDGDQDDPSSIQLAVCEYTEPDAIWPVASDPTQFTSRWNSILPLRVARGLKNGAAVNSWRGSISEIRAWDGVRGWNQIYDSCVKVTP